MAEKVRIPLKEAERLAQEVLELLAPAAVRGKVAGSIRRRRPDVGDIEIVVEPMFEARQVGMFEDEMQVEDLHSSNVQRLIAEGVFDHRRDVNGHKACGPRFQRLTYKGFALDIFCVLESSDWGVILLLRTGSGDFNKRIVRQAHEGGTVLPMGMKFGERCLWDRGVLIPTPTEESVFEAIGMAYVRPEDRHG